MNIANRLVHLAQKVALRAQGVKSQWHGVYLSETCQDDPLMYRQRGNQQHGVVESFTSSQPSN